MKRIEFKAKYSNSEIEIKPNLANSPSTNQIEALMSWIKDICRELNLNWEYPIESLINRSSICCIFDATLQARLSPSKISLETFISDWKLVHETEQKEKEEQEKEKYKEIEQSLRQLSIETDSFERITNSEHLKYIKEKGYIQGTTTRTISLWWHVNGERVVFICGQGIFKLSSIK